jgi:hypothetical protein
MTPGERRENVARRARIRRLEQEVADLREMLERLVAESLTEVGPMDVTVREAQGLLRRTGSVSDQPVPPVPDDATIAVTFTHVDRYRRKTYRAGGLYLSLGGGPGIGHVAMRVDPGGMKWATTDDAAAAWLIEQGLPADRTARLVADAIRARDCT